MKRLFSKLKTSMVGFSSFIIDFLFVHSAHGRDYDQKMYEEYGVMQPLYGVDDLLEQLLLRLQRAFIKCS